MITRATIRNFLMLAIAAISASLEAPRLVHQPLSSATAELADATGAIGDAVQNVADNVTESHLGFDTNVYPGDKAMNAWKRSGEYEWVGYYLPAPCHKDLTWTNTRAHLEQNGWGLAVIYVGQQTWGRRLPVAPPKPAARTSAKSKKHKTSRATRSMSRTSSAPIAAAGKDCSASLVTGAQGIVDARDAIARTAHEGFARGSVVFLDLEYMDVIPQPMRDYYRAWTRTVLADGRYRPGIYAHTRNAASIYDDVSDEYAQAGIDDDPPFWVAGAKGFSPGRPPTDVGHTFASAWQGALDVVRTHNGVKLPIDISVAAVASPSGTAPAANTR
jgi:hypothetical protein